VALGHPAARLKTMTKSDLVDHLCAVQKMAKGRAELIVNAIFDSMEEALKRGERIEIRGLGSFEVRSYKAYEGRNPRTGSPVAVKPKRLPFFKVGKELKERVNMAGAAPPAPVATAARDGGVEARVAVRPDPARTAVPAAVSSAATDDRPLPRSLTSDGPNARL
jgi:integration host factor subunit beta